MLLNVSVSKSAVNHLIRVFFFQMTLKDPLVALLQPSAFGFMSSPDCLLVSSSLLILLFIN